MKVVSVVGARPQFIKAAPLLEELRRAGHAGYLVHTGQHYDAEMSQIFFDEMGIPAPDLNLNVGSGPHGWQTGQMMVDLERVLLQEKPDWVLVYGDTNSTLAGALSAAKLTLPVAHIEAGLRSFNRRMPEEHNRVLTDHISTLLFCPTQTAVSNLAREGITQGVHLVGDTMYDAVLKYAKLAAQKSGILQQLGLTAGEYAVATVHRPYNTDTAQNLLGILHALGEIDGPVVLPIHPRTRRKVVELAASGRLEELPPSLRLIDPLGYLDMLALEQSARLILTDSGGMQKEAYFLSVPCVTLRPETEWVETVEAGWNVVAGQSAVDILAAVAKVMGLKRGEGDFFGDGTAAAKICAVLRGDNL
jgi:UDP-N-acetylglucosamine 2-epimerase